MLTPNVPPLQGGDIFGCSFTWGFTPGFNMTGLQPESGNGPIKRTVRSYQRFINRPSPGLKARHVIARAEGPGKPPPQIPQAL